MYADIAGQVSKSPANPVVTTAAVAIPPELQRVIRRKLMRDLGDDPRTRKWKHGKLEGLGKIVDVLASHRLTTAVVHVHRRPDAWARYYAQAAAFERRAGQPDGRRPWYMDGDEVLRMRLMANTLAPLTGRLLRAKHPWGDGPATMTLECVVDSDLRETDTRAQFRQILVEWAATSPLHAELNVRPDVSARVANEEEEPLLLIADYVAGVYQHADPQSLLAHPVVSRDAAAAAIHDLRRRLNSPPRFGGM